MALLGTMGLLAYTGPAGLLVAFLLACWRSWVEGERESAEARAALERRARIAAAMAWADAHDPFAGDDEVLDNLGKPAGQKSDGWVRYVRREHELQADFYDPRRRP